MAKQSEGGKKPNRYGAIIERIFFDRYADGQTVVEFTRQDIIDTSDALGIALPKNVGDVLYSFRYRTLLPERIRNTCPPSESWYIFPAGPSVLVPEWHHRRD